MTTALAQVKCESTVLDIMIKVWKIIRNIQPMLLTHNGRVTHICVSEVTIIVSNNGFSPGRRQAIIWNNARILLIGPLGTNFTGILIEIHTFSFKKMHLKMSSGKWRPFCLGLNVLSMPAPFYKKKHGNVIKNNDMRIITEASQNNAWPLYMWIWFIIWMATFIIRMSTFKVLIRCAR